MDFVVFKQPLQPNKAVALQAFQVGLLLGKEITFLAHISTPCLLLFLCQDKEFMGLCS